MIGHTGVAEMVGGQAVMEGVVMRSEINCALAVRRPDGGILVELRPWLRLGRKEKRARFWRGFPILLETLLNGISALNRSAELGERDEEKPLSRWQLSLTLTVAVSLALGLFVLLPHVLALAMDWLGWGSGMTGLSFHLWDGLFKFVVLVLYIAAICLAPDIRRVFQYHGAEHKVIGAFEAGGEVSVRSAARFSRLHPRCGTTFLFFVLAVSIVLHALLAPLLLWLWEPQGVLLRNGGVLLFKLALIIPISSLAYEFTRMADAMGDNIAGRLARFPGLALQMLTTREPDRDQLEVAVVALAEALGEEFEHRFQTPAYTVLE